MTTLVPTTTTSTNVQELDAATVQRMLRAGTARLIDVREPDEHRRERIAEAELRPVSVIDAAQFSGDANSSVLCVLHCRSGRRSMEAAQRLRAAGVANIASLQGGIEAWKAAGQDVVRDAKAPIPIMRQVQLVIGACVVLSVALGAFVTPWALVLAAFMGCGLLVAGLTGTCGLAAILGTMPWNRIN